MDPKQSGTPGNLDPKLKEAYERVMGLAPNPSVQKIPQPAPAAPVTPMPNPPAGGSIPQPQVTPPPMPTMQTVGTSRPGSEPVHLTSQMHGFVASKQKKKSPISPVVIVLGAVVFIIVYTLVWIKIFNVQIPFLPQ